MTGSSTGPERTHYRYATRREQLHETWREFLANRRLQLALAAVLFVLVMLRILTPASAGLAGVQAGDCLFIRTSAARGLVTERPVGEPDEVRATLRANGAEMASCDLSHSHEVAAAGDLPDAPGADYPGEAALLDREAAACTAAVEGYVGRAAEGSRYIALVVVPDMEGWRSGQRDLACLVQRSDGQFMDRRAAGSGQ